jgi:hypothetical protein
MLDLLHHTLCLISDPNSRERGQRVAGHRRIRGRGALQRLHHMREQGPDGPETAIAFPINARSAGQ